MNPLLEIINIGMGCSVQDLGRPGWRRYGVPPGGAMDPHALSQANRLIGNPDGAPALEFCMQGAKVKVLRDTWIGLGGANLGTGFGTWTACRLSTDTVLNLKGGPHGLWQYLAVPGGLCDDQYFGSVSSDARSGIGSTLKAGDILQSEAKSGADLYPSVQRRQLIEEVRRSYAESETFLLLPGPQCSSFPAEARAQLVKSEWTVAARSDKSGYRLESKKLPMAPSIHSEPVLAGSFQVTTDGTPIVTMPFGPTVGGYPKIALLHESDLPRFAQCRPGTKLHFKWDAS